MIDFTIETQIARTPTEVFAYVTDVAKLPTWQTNTVSAVAEGDGPLAVGTRIHEVHRGPGGREVASLVEVSELDADRIFALQMIEGPLPVHARIELKPSADGTKLAFRVHGQPRGVQWLAQPLLKRVLRSQFAQHCDTLRQVLEEDAGRA